MTGMGVGGLLIGLVVWSLSHYDWRDTTFFSGLMIFCLGLPPTLLIRDQPCERPPSRFLSTGHSSALFVVGTVLVHQIPHTIEHLGLSPEVAAVNVTL